MGKHGHKDSGIRFEREYNQICGKILGEERSKREISREELARGIISKTALGQIETGRIGWTKLPGDTLMHRMGVGTDYFEVVASAEELDRWRRREDICLLLPARLLAMARKAVSCTLPQGWEQRMGSLWLAPSELEAVLLEAAARMACGREEEAWELWQAVRGYPKAHH